MELVLNKRGVYLSVENDLYLIKKDKNTLQKVPAKKVNSIVLGKSQSFSTDAVLTAIRHDTPMVIVDSIGRVEARIWSPKFGSISTIRKKQLEFSKSKNGAEWVKEVVIQKIYNQEVVLLTLQNETNRFPIQESVRKIKQFQQKLCTLDFSKELQMNYQQIRSWEGAASKVYFQQISASLPQEFRFSKRTRKPAKDIFNACLNYAYGMLYNTIESAMIKAGIDPYIGVMHRDDYNKPSLVYDMIECYRAWADFVVIDLLNQKVLFKEHFSIAREQDFYLESAGKRILVQSMNDYLEDKILFNRKMISRKSKIDQDVQQLIKKL